MICPDCGCDEAFWSPAQMCEGVELCPDHWCCLNCGWTETDPRWFDTEDTGDRGACE